MSLTPYQIAFKELLPENFDGTAYRLADIWQRVIPIDKDVPLKYLEIGAFHGANLISFANCYCKNRNAVELHAIDPWIDYEEYPEYKGQQDVIFSKFKKNIESANLQDKVVIHRGFSHEVLHTLPDNYFDIIYIDGNHEPEYVCEDGVLSFRKLKKGGYMIFDDYGWGGPDLTQRGIDSFISAYHKRMKLINVFNGQLYAQKL